MNSKDIDIMAFFNKHRSYLISAMLVIATLTAYWSVRNHDFVNFDDDDYDVEVEYRP